MSARTKPTWVLLLMILWYALLLMGTGALALLGAAFGSEAYRNNPIPIAELALIYGPFLAVLTLLLGTIVLWTKGKVREAIALWGASVFLGIAAILFGGILGI